MNSKAFRRTFAVFHVTLGVVIFLQAAGIVVRTLSVHAVRALQSHVTVLAVVEALAALLFLFPKTARVGGGILLGAIAVALFVHGLRGELPLLVYAAGVILVIAEGGTYKM